MSHRKVDVAIIGAGTAGLNARRECQKAGLDWVLIESGPYGTTCARVGCMPSKLLIAAAENAHEIQRSDLFGNRVEGFEVDGPAVMERVQRERDRFVGFVVESTLEIPEERRIRGHARFVDDSTLQIDGQDTIEADRFVVATGSHPWIPPQLEAIKDHVMVNDDIFELQDLPDSMAVVGTGIIGLELGQAMQRLGVDVDFFNPFDELGPFSDPEVIAKAHDSFGKRLNLHLESEITDTRKDDQGLFLAWNEADDSAHQRHFDIVLAAAGRRPNTAQLGLENTSVPRDDRDLPITDPRTTQAGDTSIFFAGDVSGHRPLLHEASDEGRIAGKNASIYPNIEARIRRTQLAIAFTDPQMAVVGRSYDQLNLDCTEIASVSFDNQGRSRVMGINEGLVRLYADRRNCQLIGAEMFGPRVEHTAHLLAWAIDSDQKIPDLLSRPFYHPVIEEGIRTGLRNLAKGLRITGQCSAEAFGESPGS